MVVDYVWTCMMTIGVMCSIFGIFYPLVALICFPFYRRLFEPDITLKEYMKGL